jgi:Leucine-rich repeat (LRR) protein
MTTLNLTSTRVTDESLAKISRIESLAFLALEHDHISNGCIHFLRNNRNLTALDLRYNDISDDAVADLAANTVQLTELYLGGNKITDKAILFLNQFKSIEKLDVSDTLISSNGLRRIATFDRLSYLDVSNVRASDANVRELITRLPNLSKINLANTQVSDRSMPSVAKSTRLSAIDLSNCSITKQGIRELCQSNTIDEIVLDQALLSSLSRERVIPSKKVLRFSDENLWTRPDVWRSDL